MSKRNNPDAVVQAAREHGGFRVLRCGSWFFDARSVRCAFRYASVPGHRVGNCGFRPVIKKRVR